MNDIPAFPSKSSKYLYPKEWADKPEYLEIITKMHEIKEENAGMTLRDYFAAKILGTLYCDMDDIEGMARMSYEIADAMLKERGEK